jgi:biotin carboxylase
LKLEDFEQLVIKPLDSQSSKGVILLHNNMKIQALEEAYLMARNYSPSQSVICEPFIEGTEYTFEGVILNSKFELIGISKKSHSSFGIANALFYSKEWKAIYGELIIDLMQSLTYRHCVDNVVIHGEFLAKSSSDIKIVEIASRGGGTNVGSTICKLLVGYSPVERVLHALEIGEYEATNFQTFSFVALMFLEFFEESKNPTEFLSLCKCNAKSPLVDFDIEIDLGDKIPEIRDDRSRHGWIIIASNSRKKLIDFTAELNKIVEYELVKEKIFFG